MRATFVFACFLALAGRALAELNIVMGGTLGNITTAEFLTFNDSTTLTSDCQTDCSPGLTDIANCAGDDTCLCSNETIAAVTACQQCYFNDLISQNIKMPDPRAGSAVALTAYAAACLASTANITVPATSVALTLPANWDGPVSLTLNTGQTVVAVISGTILGGGALMLLSNL